MKYRYLRPLYAAKARGLITYADDWFEGDFTKEEEMMQNLKPEYCGFVRVCNDGTDPFVYLRDLPAALQPEKLADLECRLATADAIAESLRKEIGEHIRRTSHYRNLCHLLVNNIIA